MDLGRLKRRGAFDWEIPRHGAMRVPGVLYASGALVEAMDDKVYEQVVNVADAARHREGVVRHARRALGLRLPHRRGGGLRPGRRRRGVGRRGGLRHFLRRALPHHRAVSAGRGAPEAAAGRRAVPAHPRGRGQHRRHSPLAGRPAGDADGRGALGGEGRLGPRGRPSAHRGRRADAGREAGPGVRRREAPPEGRDGHAGQRQPLPRGAAGGPGVRRRGGARLRPRRRRRGGVDSLRLARAGAPAGHRVPAGDGAGRKGLRPDPARPRAGLRAHRLGAGPRVPGGDARRHQLRAGQPADSHPPGARGLRRGAAPGRPAPRLRRVAQHL